MTPISKRSERAYLEKSADVLKRKLTRDIHARKHDNMRYAAAR